MAAEADTDLLSIAEFYSAPGVAWALRSIGPHLHAGGEDASVWLAERLAAFGYAGGGRIVEIASALGGPARYLAHRFFATVLCIDGDLRMQRAAALAATAEGLGGRVLPIIARTEALPLASRSCDAAWSQDALCHMHQPPVVREAARVLKPLGLFALSDWVALDELTRDERAALARFWSFPGLLRLGEYVQLLDESGFDVLLAEDRSAAIAARPHLEAADQQEWERRFGSRYGAAALERQQETYRVWSALVRAGRTGHAAFVARRRAGD